MKRRPIALQTIFGALALCLLWAPAFGAEPQANQSPQTGPSRDVETEEIQSDGTPSISLTWDATFASKYLFQGIDYSDGKPVIQPELALGVQGISVVLWMNYDVDTNISNEYDLYLQYGRQVGRLAVSPGYAHYRYPNRAGWDPSNELLVDLSYDVPLNPSVSFHYDYDAGDGSYTTLGLSHAFPARVAAFTLATNLFYQSSYYELTGIPSWELTASTEYSLPLARVGLAVSRFQTWENGDFAGKAAVPASWLLFFNVAQDF